VIVVHDLAELPGDLGPTAVAVGKFDGVHLGHRAVLGRLADEAREHDLVPAVVTFDRNPLALLRPDQAPPPLVSVAQRLELLADAGVELTLMLAFDGALAALPPEEFAERYLFGGLRARAVLVGEDFRFGAHAAGDVALLERMAAERDARVVALPSVLGADAERVSTTRVRRLLAEGEVGEAARLLGRPHAVRAVVVHGLQRGRELGWPTANLHPDAEGLVPADGVYAGWATVDGERYPAAVSVGDNPTFEGVPARQVEAYLLDVDLDLYGRTLEVAFVARLRGNTAFTGIEALKAQIGRDVETTRELLVG
jgi:riboflavin kinase / FMN adenylyltransferase